MGRNHRYRVFNTNVYVKNARGALIVFDVTKHSTFENVERWYNELRDANSDLEIMLIGNKTDLLKDDEMTTFTETAKEFADRVSLRFIETSAKNNINVEKAFAGLVTQIFKKVCKNDALALPKFSSEALMSRWSGKNEPAHYMLKIECFSFLIEAGTNKFESDDFEAGGYTWRLELYPNEEEDEVNFISIYVVICDTESLPEGWEVWIDAKFCVYDHVRENYIIFQDLEQKRTRLCEKNIKWGFNKLISLESFTDAANGCLFHDSCVFGAEVFVVPKYAEKDQCLSMIKPSAHVNTHTWKIDNFSAIAMKKLYSDYFKVGKVKWKLVLYLKGTVTGKGTHLSVFLQVHATGSDPDGLNAYAKYNIRVKNINAFSDRVRGYQNWFRTTALGYQRFMLLSELHDLDKNFLLNDVLTVEAKVSVVGVLKNFD